MSYHSIGQRLYEEMVTLAAVRGFTTGSIASEVNATDEQAEWLIDCLYGGES